MTDPSPVEIELKLALPQHQVAAFRKLMARRRSVPTQQRLVTRYFDTPDFALSAQGVALRVRRVGRRWVQTLKTEGERSGGLSRREEYEMPVSRGVPDWSRFPAEALARVPASLREKLAPVFETHFTRTAWQLKPRGGAHVEVALDVGEVRAGNASQPICEIELELKAGQPDVLFELAQNWAQKLDCIPQDMSKAERGVRLAHGQHAAPAQPVSLAFNRHTTVEDGFSAIVQACLAQFQANLPGVLADTDIEYVHQARVALRRLRAVLRLYRRVCVLPDELLTGLHALVATLGPTRDWDVLCSETLPEIAPHFADDVVWRQGMEMLESHRADVRSTMRANLIKARPGAWLLDCQRWFLLRGWRVISSEKAVSSARRQVQGSPLKKWARQALRKGHRTIARRAGAGKRLRPEQLHALRIAIKRQRDAADFFKSLFGGRKHARYQTGLHLAQDTLGRANDLRVGRTLMRALRAETGPMGAFVLGWLAAQESVSPSLKIAKRLQRFVKSGACW